MLKLAVALAIGGMFLTSAGCCWPMHEGWHRRGGWGDRDDRGPRGYAMPASYRQPAPGPYRD